MTSCNASIPAILVTEREKRARPHRGEEIWCARFYEKKIRVHGHGSGRPTVPRGEPSNAAHHLRLALPNAGRSE